MKNQIITLDFQVECDRCHHPVRAGEKCSVSMNPRTGNAYFCHLHCPTACANRKCRPQSPVNTKVIAYA